LSLAILFASCTEGVLATGRRADAAWTIETVDSGLQLGEGCSLTLDATGNPHISYSGPRSLSVRYAVKVNGAWTVQTVDARRGGTNGTSIALDANGEPSIAYADRAGGPLVYAHKTSGLWRTEIVDPAGGSDPSLAFDSQGHPHIAYASGSRELLFATRSDSSWNVTRTGLPDFGSHTLVLDPFDYSHVSYIGQRGAKLPPMYLYRDRQGAAHERNVNPRSTASGLSFAFGRIGAAHFSYANRQTDPRGLIYEEISCADCPPALRGLDPYGGRTSIALDANGQPGISYVYDMDEAVINLRYASRATGSWMIEVVTDLAHPSSTSLALNALGDPRIAFASAADGAVRFAYKDAARVRR
jgi:hypothetical protein